MLFFHERIVFKELFSGMIWNEVFYWQDLSKNNAYSSRKVSLLLTLFPPWYFDLVFALERGKITLYFVSDGRKPNTWNLAQILNTLFSLKESKKIILPLEFFADVSISNKNTLFSLPYLGKRKRLYLIRCSKSNTLFQSKTLSRLVYLFQIYTYDSLVDVLKSNKEVLSGL